MVTNCSNNYGPYQFPEKLIPVIIKSLVKNNKIPIYGDGNKLGSGYLWKTIVTQY